jgi:hypothetical protein
LARRAGPRFFPIWPIETRAGGVVALDRSIYER